ncbi:MAG: enoyl-CoA hydratase/isomerase family protein [Flavobacteriales bacterium]|nr:enoyl-CoA hydratase/isomerase family protein [Flavobacteriales bacterium]
MAYPNLLVEQSDRIAQVTINRPDKLNALNISVIDDVSKCMRELDANPEVRCIILTGAGDKAFVAGADISEFAGFTVEEGRNLSAEGHRKLFDLIEEMGTPVIAAINGFALGGGLELAMSCHMRVASDNARMGLPEVSLGVIPGYGGTQRLPRLVGKGRAMEMITTAQMIDANTALLGGLVNHVVASDALLEKCREIASKIARNSPTAIGYAIAAVNAGDEGGVDGFEEEIHLFGEAFGTDDFKEGTSAFLEKRKPDFKGK